MDVALHCFCFGEVGAFVEGYVVGFGEGSELLADFVG